MVWFEGAQTAETGPERFFVSPPLTPGQRYTYEVRARWVEGGRPVEEDRTVSVTANRWTDVDFTAAPPAGQADTQPAAPARPATRPGSTPADDEPAPLPPAGGEGPAPVRTVGGVPSGLWPRPRIDVWHWMAPRQRAPEAQDTRRHRWPLTGAMSRPRSTGWLA